MSNNKTSADTGPDTVITLKNDGVPVMAIAIEVLPEADPENQYRWVSYMGALYARMKCPVTLLVICMDQELADRYAAPINFGPPGSVLTPTVLGPAQIPVVVDPTRDSVEMTVFSALAHGNAPDSTPTLKAFLDAMKLVDSERADSYTEVVRSTLGESARKRLDDLIALSNGATRTTATADRHLKIAG